MSRVSRRWSALTFLLIANVGGRHFWILGGLGCKSRRRKCGICLVAFTNGLNDSMEGKWIASSLNYADGKTGKWLFSGKCIWNGFSLALWRRTDLAPFWSEHKAKETKMTKYWRSLFSFLECMKYLLQSGVGLFTRRLFPLSFVFLLRTAVNVFFLGGGSFVM